MKTKVTIENSEGSIEIYIPYVCAITSLKRSIDRKKERLSKIEGLKAPRVVIDNEKRIIAKLERMLKDVEDDMAECRLMNAIFGEEKK